MCDHRRRDEGSSRGVGKGNRVLHHRMTTALFSRTLFLASSFARSSCSLLLFSLTSLVGQGSEKGPLAPLGSFRLLSLSLANITEAAAAAARLPRLMHDSFREGEGDDEERRPLARGTRTPRASLSCATSFPSSNGGRVASQEGKGVAGRSSSSSRSSSRCCGCVAGTEGSRRGVLLMTGVGSRDEVALLLKQHSSLS